MSIIKDADKVLLYVYNHFMKSLKPLNIDIVNELHIDNDARVVIEHLNKQYFIQTSRSINGPGILGITSYGIDYAEQNLSISLSELQKRKKERKIILKKLYEEKKQLAKQELQDLIRLDEHILVCHLLYLYDKGLVELQRYIGGIRSVGLTSEGIRFIESGMVESIIQHEESYTLEFKSSLRWDYKLNKPNKGLAEPVLKTLVAFMNSDGGILLIGVGDDKNILGLDNDFKDLKDWDHWQQTLINYINNRIGKEFHEFIEIEHEKRDRKIVAKINIEPSNKPVYLDKSKFYIRAGNTSLQLNNEQRAEYIQNHKRYKNNSY